MTCGRCSKVGIRQRLRQWGRWYQRFVERQGFAIVMTACIGVIVLTAVWSGRNEETLPVPTPPVDQAQEAAQLQQQRLAEAATPTPAPSAAPETWQCPLKTCQVLRPFDITRMSRSAVTGLWQVHDGVDLKAEAGEAVRAMADGTVVSCAAEGVTGGTVTVEHGGVTATYAGMAMLAGLRPGDPVEAGQTLGFAGDGMVGETDIETHLHLSVIRDGQAVDPMLLLRKGK